MLPDLSDIYFVDADDTLDFSKPLFHFTYILLDRRDLRYVLTNSL